MIYKENRYEQVLKTKKYIAKNKIEKEKEKHKNK